MNSTIRGYRIRWRDGESNRQVVASIDHQAKRIRLTAPDGGRVSVDVVGARAVAMLLSDAVYRALEPDGPLLALETDAGDGWIDLRELS